MGFLHESLLLPNIQAKVYGLLDISEEWQQENKVGYQEAFRDIVLKPFREDEEINQEVNQYLVAYQQSRTEFSSFDHYIRMKILGYARTPCETHALALLYSYTYMPMHLDGNKKVIEREYQTFFKPYIYQKPSNVLMIDVGCGPMTACMALADFQQSLPAKKRLELDYLGCDIHSFMTDIALNFNRKKNQNDLFGDHFRGCYPDIKNPHWIEQVDCPVKDGGTLVFYFSYFWEQGGVTEEVGKWVDCVKRISLQARAEDTFLVYLNRDLGDSNSAYTEFKQRIRERPDTLEVISSEKCNHKYQSWSGLEEWLTQGIVPKARPKKRTDLHYEILRVDWKHYEDAGTDTNTPI
jgi:hypothetical protein